MFVNFSAPKIAIPIAFVLMHSFLSKFSLIMHDSFQMLSDTKDILEKIEIYNKLASFVKKFSPHSVGILFDTSDFSSAGSYMANLAQNNKGFGYEIINSFGGSKINNQDSDAYSIVFSHPKLSKEASEKHVKTLINYLNTENDQKVKYFYEQVHELGSFKIQDYS
jgi:hypothetical protein